MTSSRRSSRRHSVVSPVRDGGDCGSAVVEFVLVSVLVVVLLLAVVQLADGSSHPEHTGVGGRGGRAVRRRGGPNPEDGAEHTRTLIRQSLPDVYADSVSADYATVGGVQTVEVQVRPTFPSSAGSDRQVRSQSQVTRWRSREIGPTTREQRWWSSSFSLSRLAVPLCYLRAGRLRHPAGSLWCQRRNTRGGAGLRACTIDGRRRAASAAAASITLADHGSSCCPRTCRSLARRALA